MIRLYLAAPFFNPLHLAVVEAVEAKLAQEPCIEVYSPRKDGVLQDMSPEQRAAEAPHVFKRNVARLLWASHVLCLLDYSDTGTTWEMGFTYGVNEMIMAKQRKRLYAFRSNNDKPLNIMLRNALHGYCTDINKLCGMLMNADGVNTFALPDTF